MPHPCLLSGPKEGGNATAPLHSRESPNKGTQSEVKKYTTGTNDAPSIPMDGSVVQPNTQIVGFARTTRQVRPLNPLCCEVIELCVNRGALWSRNALSSPLSSCKIKLPNPVHPDSYLQVSKDFLREKGTAKETATPMESIASQIVSQKDGHACSRHSSSCACMATVICLPLSFGNVSDAILNQIYSVTVQCPYRSQPVAWSGMGRPSFKCNNKECEAPHTKASTKTRRDDEKQERQKA